MGEREERIGRALVCVLAGERESERERERETERDRERERILFHYQSLLR